MNNKNKEQSVNLPEDRVLVSLPNGTQVWLPISQAKNLDMDALSKSIDQSLATLRQTMMNSSKMQK